MNSEEKRRKLENNKIVLAPLSTVTHRQILEQLATSDSTSIELPSGSGTSIFTVEKFQPGK